jgi:hypothetical protein
VLSVVEVHTVLVVHLSTVLYQQFSAQLKTARNSLFDRGTCPHPHVLMCLCIPIMIRRRELILTGWITCQQLDRSRSKCKRTNLLMTVKYRKSSIYYLYT